MLVTGVAMTAMVMWGATPVVTKLGAAEIDPLAVGMLRTLQGEPKPQSRFE